MGRASSSKKIARAARAGGRARGARQRDVGFPAAIAAIVLLGSGLVVTAWQDRQDDAVNVEPKVGDHWHAAYGGYVCDEFVEPAAETTPMQGIHTHGDGLIHIEPSSPDDAGEEAKLGLFLDVAEIELSDEGLKVGDQSWKPNEDQCDGKDGEVVLAQWKNGQGDEGPALIRDRFDNLRFRNDGEAYTVAFVAEGTTEIPKPPTVSELANVVEPEPDPEAGEADPGSSTTTAPAPDTPPQPPPG